MAIGARDVDNEQNITFIQNRESMNNNNSLANIWFTIKRNKVIHKFIHMGIIGKCYHMRIIVMGMLIAACCVSSCSKDDDTADIGSELNVVVDNNGVANGGHSFTRIDDKNFYIDDIKYTVVDSTLEVTWYDATFFKGEAKIISSLNYHGTILSVRSIGKESFKSCEALTTLSIPQNVKSIKESAFRNCKQLKSISIKGEGLNTIDDSAFSGCISITSFTIPNSVVSVGSWSFAECSSLTSVIIGKNVTSVNKDTFRGCTSLASIKVESSNTVFDSRDNCNAIIVTKTNTLFLGCKTTTIPNSVTTIDDNAFEGCTGLTTINIPTNVTSIGSYAFEGCTGLSNVGMSNSITSIGVGLFAGCTNLASFSIPNSVTTVEHNAFKNCTALASLTIGNNVEAISTTAFSGCSGLTTVTINSNSIVSKDYDFNYENFNLYNLPKLFGDKVSKYIIGEEVTAIGERAFLGCTGLTQIDISNSVKSIGMYAFSSCTGLFSITIPNSVSSIERGTFKDCTSLSSITIPNSVSSIGWDAFACCSSLKSVIIGSAVTNIDYYAFGYCPLLADLYCYAESVPNSNTSFYETNINNIILHVPTASIEAYKAISPWNKFKNIVALRDSDPKP